MTMHASPRGAYYENVSDIRRSKLQDENISSGRLRSYRLRDSFENMNGIGNDDKKAYKGSFTVAVVHKMFIRNWYPWKDTSLSEGMMVLVLLRRPKIQGAHLLSLLQIGLGPWLNIRSTVFFSGKKLLEQSLQQSIC